jgi:hypothetical protein
MRPRGLQGVSALQIRRTSSTQVPPARRLLPHRRRRRLRRDRRRRPSRLVRRRRLRRRPARSEQPPPPRVWRRHAAVASGHRPALVRVRVRVSVPVHVPWTCRLQAACGSSRVAAHVRPRPRVRRPPPRHPPPRRQRHRSPVRTRATLGSHGALAAAVAAAVAAAAASPLLRHPHRPLHRPPTLGSHGALAAVVVAAAASPLLRHPLHPRHRPPRRRLHRLPQRRPHHPLEPRRARRRRNGCRAVSSSRRRHRHHHKVHELSMIRDGRHGLCVRPRWREAQYGWGSALSEIFGPRRAPPATMVTDGRGEHIAAAGAVWQPDGEGPRGRQRGLAAFASGMLAVRACMRACVRACVPQREDAGSVGADRCALQCGCGCSSGQGRGDTSERREHGRDGLTSLWRVGSRQSGLGALGVALLLARLCPRRARCVPGPPRSAHVWGGFSA